MNFIQQESDARKKAHKHYMDVLYVRLNAEVWLSREGKEAIDVAKNMLYHTGNICNCLCERIHNLISDTPRGKLLDSICFDPVSVDDDQ